MFEDFPKQNTEALAVAEMSRNSTALSPAEQAEQEEIELDEKLAYYINQYDPDNPLPANSEDAHSEKTKQSSNKKLGRNPQLGQFMTSVDDTQPLITHLVELRNRLLRSIIFVAVIICGARLLFQWNL